MRTLVPPFMVLVPMLLLVPVVAVAEERREGSGLHAIESPAACDEVEVDEVRYRMTATGTAGHPTFVVPPNPVGSTLVDIGLYVMHISKINEVDNTFRIQGFLDLVWCDPRLGFDKGEAGVGEHVYLEHNAKARLEEIWWPDPDFVNQMEPRKIENEALIVRSDGTVDYEELFTTVLKSPFDLRKFPFDRQRLYVEIESFVWNADNLRFHEEIEKIGFSERFGIPEWNITSVNSSVRVQREVRDRAPFSEFVLEIVVARKPGYYVWKLIFPLIVIVCASWVVFWLTGRPADARLGLAFRGVLIVVAYQFVITGKLPRISYFTFMDAFLIFSFLMMAATIVQNGIVAHWQRAEREDSALRLDRASRWIFPVIYVAGLTGIFLGYGVV